MYEVIYKHDGQRQTLRRLIGYAEMLSEVVKGSQLDQYVQDAIGDGEYMLKQLGGGRHKDHAGRWLPSPCQCLNAAHRPYPGPWSALKRAPPGHSH